MGTFGGIYTIKASRLYGINKELDYWVMAENQVRGIETTIVPDNNVMIAIEKCAAKNAPATDETLAENGLLEFVVFLRECSRKKLGYFFSPYFSFNEMPESQAIGSIRLFEVFLKKFDIGLHGAHNEIKVDFDQIGRKKHNSFYALRETDQKFLAIPFSALLLALAINHIGGEFSSIGRFRRYLREYKKLIDIFSGKEVAIARYIFSDECDCDAKLKLIRQDVINNFARIGKKRKALNFEEMEAIALNGASDIALLNSMNIIEAKGIDGVRQDCWLVTFDRKLAVYNTVCFNSGFGNGNSGAFIKISTHHGVSEYWDQSEEELRKLEQRIKNRKLDFNIAALPKKAHEVIEFSKKCFEV